MATINLSSIDFGGIQTPSVKLQEKTVDILLTNPVTEIVPDEGFDGMSRVIANHAPVQETTKQTITSNGSHIITPDTGYDAMIQCVVDVNVSGEIDFSSIGYTPEMTKEVNDKINSDIAHSEQLLAEYDDTKKYTNDKKLVYAPLFPTQNRTNFYEMFYGCSSLITVPPLDTSKGTTFEYMFRDCGSLIKIPAIDTSKGTNFRYMFNNCFTLTEIPLIDTSKGTTFENTFYNCDSLTTIPSIDTSNGTNFYATFYGCSSLITVPPLDTSKGTDFYNMFSWCTSLQTIPQIDISNADRISGFVERCNKLKNIVFNGSINLSIYLYDCTKLSYDSIKSILTACSNTTNTDAKTVSFRRTIADQNGELTNLVADCTGKGWTISGLTITQ